MWWSTAKAARLTPCAVPGSLPTSRHPELLTQVERHSLFPLSFIFFHNHLTLLLGETSMLLDSSCDFTSHFKATSPVMAMQDWFEAGSVASGGSASTSKPHPQQTSSLQEFVIDDAVYGRHVIQEVSASLQSCSRCA